MTIQEQNRFDELEQAINANDEYLQRLEALNAELLRLLKLVLPDVRMSENRFAIRDAIAKAEAKP